MECIKCGEAIDQGLYKSEKYCSYRCQKLFLKSLYKKRTAEHQRAYQREYRRAKNGGSRPPKKPAALRGAECMNCGSTDDLQLAHVKPLWAGGNHKHVFTLCRQHHHQFDNLLREFWKVGILTSSTIN